MARPKSRVPKLVHHKPTGQARVRINGRDIYLGKYGTPEAEDAYRRIVTQLLQDEPIREEPPQFDDLTVDELLLRYWEDFASRYYRKNGQATSRLYVIRASGRLLREHFGDSTAREFGPRKLKTLQHEMIRQGWCRRTVNDYSKAIKAVFQWGVSEELLPSSVYEALRTVPGLKKGRTEARESGPVQPVPEKHVNAVLPKVSRQVADMIRLQLLMGCRPAEICILRPRDLDRSGDVWLYRPESHKVEHTGRERIIFAGPRAQAILEPWLDRPADSYCFSPAEAEAARRAERRRKRKSKLTPSQAARQRAEDPARAPAERYTPTSYRRAIQRGCEKAKVAKWSPNQLRHNRGTVIRKTYGIEPAQLVLGHADADVTQVYAERDLERAKEIMREVG